jgi:hypothetical protein
MKPTFSPEQEAEMDAYRRRSNMAYELHGWINARQDERRKDGQPFEYSLYEWKRAMEELPRMVIWLRKARTGDLRTVHKQCSHSAPEAIESNRLICARGIDVTECPILKSLYAYVAEDRLNRGLTPDDADELAADVCAWHIFTGTLGMEDEDKKWRRFDTSEGYVQDESDRRFWSNVYTSLAGADREL